MATRTPAATREGPLSSAVTPAQPGPWLKGVLSALIALHVLAVFWAPFAFASNSGPVPSPFAEAVFNALRPYISALYLDHGYFFFAPDPGPAHLVDYKVEFDDGRPPVTGRFPDLRTQRPRLLYHRHFMLSESLNNRFVPAAPPPEPSPPPLTASTSEKILHATLRQQYEADLVRWQHARKQYEAMRESFENHLKHEFGGQRVTLTRVEHALASPDEVELAGRRLDAPESYRNMPESPALPAVTPRLP